MQAGTKIYIVTDYHIEYETNDFVETHLGSSWSDHLFSQICGQNARLDRQTMTKTMLQLLQIHCAVQSEVQFQFQLQLQYSTTCIIVQNNIYSTVQYSFSCSTVWYSPVAVQLQLQSQFQLQLQYGSGSIQQSSFCKRKRLASYNTNGYEWKMSRRAWRVQMEKRKVYANAALTSTILIKTVAVWHCTFSSMFSCFCSLIFDYSTVMPTLKCRVHLPPPKKMINLTYCLKHLFERNLTGSPTGPTYILQYYISS